MRKKITDIQSEPDEISMMDNPKMLLTLDRMVADILQKALKQSQTKGLKGFELQKVFKINQGKIIIFGVDFFILTKPQR